MNISPAVKRETLFIAAFELIFSGMMLIVFLLIGQFDATVLWGSLMGALAAVLNFFLMALTVQKAVGLEEAQAKTQIKLSQRLRLLMLGIIAAVGVSLPGVFNIFALLIPMLFPRIAITLRPKFHLKGDSENAK